MGVTGGEGQDQVPTVNAKYLITKAALSLSDFPASGSEQDAIDVIEYSSDEDFEVEGAEVAAGECEDHGGD